jgi:C1A family cysteine protease
MLKGNQMASKPKAATKKAARKTKQTHRILNVLPSRGTEKDWKLSDALAGSALAAPGVLPNSIDLRETWWKINNQAITGSCVGWAVADGLLRYHLVTSNRLDKSELLSARFVWMASKETDEFNARPGSFIEEAGTSLKSALDVVRKFGCVLSKELPLEISTLMHTGNENAFYAGASTRRCANYFNLAKNLTEWKTWLATKGPVLAALRVDSTWMNATDHQGKLQVFDPNSASGGHAICIVGYTSTHFIIRNSWGADWGDKGFAYATPAYIADAFFDESYGITL